MNPIEAACAQHEANAKVEVMHNTWGHLFPKKKHYTGKLRIAYSGYSDMDNAVVDEKFDFDCSPWWYDAVTDFACDSKELIGAEDGEVWDLDVNVDIVEKYSDDEIESWEDNELYKDEEDWEPYEMESHEEMEITIIDKRRVLEAFR